MEVGSGIERAIEIRTAEFMQFWPFVRSFVRVVQGFGFVLFLWAENDENDWSQEGCIFSSFQA